MCKKRVFVCAIIFLIASATAVLSKEEALRRVVSKTPIVKEYLGSWLASTFLVSPNGSRLACVVKTDKKYSVVVDGSKGAQYDKIEDITFSSDGKHLAYAAAVGDKRAMITENVYMRYNWTIVIGDQKGKEYLDVGKPVFSPDGKHNAYAARDGKTWIAVIDEKEQEAKYNYMEDPDFSPDSKRIAYRSQIGEEPFVGAHREHGPLGISGPIMNVDWVAVIDGEASDRYQSISSIVFSPNGKRVAYMAQRDGERFIVLDGQVREKVRAFSIRRSRQACF